MLRWGANDDKESRHKEVKAAYRLTNWQSIGLPRQLLRAGYTDEQFCSSEEDAVETGSVPVNLLDPRQLKSPVRCSQEELDSHRTFEDRL